MSPAALAVLLLAAEPAPPAAACPAVKQAEVHFTIQMRVSGRKALLPFTGFFRTEVDLAMDASPGKDGVKLVLRKPLQPPYTLQSVGRTADEIQARVITGSVEEGVAAGQAILARFARQQPELDRNVASGGRKSLPFIYEAPPRGRFQFVLGSDARVGREGRRNDVKSRYAWPSDTFFHPFAYEALARALDLLASPAIAPGAGASFSAQVQEAQAVNVLGEVCGTVLPKLKDEVAFRQKGPFAVAVTGTRDANGVLTLAGKASPNLDIKDGLTLVSYAVSRKLCADGTPLHSSVEMQLRGPKGSGGQVRLAVTLK